MSGRNAFEVLSRGWDSGRPGKVHFVGIAGSGMRSLVRVFLERGWTIRGSDTGRSVDQLRTVLAFGSAIASQHAAKNVDEDCALVVYSDAIARTNPELERSAELEIATLSYFEVLGRLMWERTGIAIAGTHGKSTTTAMLADILVAARQDPTVVYGAAPPDDWCGGRSGNGPIVLVEACEYNANFLKLFPKQAVVLGIEPDHFDCYADEAEYRHAFALFAGSLPRDGCLLIPYDCPRAREAARGARTEIETFGFDPAADWSAIEVMQESGRFEFTLQRRRRRLARIRLAVPGLHNVTNAMAAAAMAYRNGVETPIVQKQLQRFRGLRRRLQPRGEFRGVTLLDDYAHHPTEIRATLRTARQMYPDRRIWCVFEPHQASRTRRLLHELADALCLANRVIVTEIFRAREERHDAGDVSSADLVRAIGERGGRVDEGRGEWRVQHLLTRGVETGDVILFMGAGDIQRHTDGFIQRLRTDRAAV